MAGHLGVFLPEKCDEVLAAALLAFAGRGHCGLECRILTVLAEVLHEFGDADLQGHGHTTLQVKTKVDLLLLAFAVSVTQQRIHLLLAATVDVGVLETVDQGFPVQVRVACHGEHGIGLLLGLSARLLLHTGCEDGEGKLINTRKRQEDGEYPKRAPILHDRWFF